MIKSSQSLLKSLVYHTGLRCKSVSLFKCEIQDDRWAEELEEAVRNYESKYLANSGLGQYELYTLLLVHHQRYPDQTFTNNKLVLLCSQRNAVERHFLESNLVNYE